jgi:uncharacterized protein (TIGR00645 family)
MEKLFGKIMFSARWIMAPVYLGLAAGLFILAYKFFLELVALFIQVPYINNEQLILHLLSLVDFVLIGGLLVMVVFSGYENFVTSLNVKGADKELSWIGKMDVESLKNKVFVSVVSISTIHLLGVFMESKSIPDDKILMYMGLHLCFVLTALLMQVLEKISKKSDDSDSP